MQHQLLFAALRVVWIRLMGVRRIGVVSRREVADWQDGEGAYGVETRAAFAHSLLPIRIVVRTDDDDGGDVAGVRLVGGNRGVGDVECMLVLQQIELPEGAFALLEIDLHVTHVSVVCLDEVLEQVSCRSQSANQSVLGKSRVPYLKTCDEPVARRCGPRRQSG